MSEIISHPKPVIILKDMSDAELLQNLTDQGWTSQEEDDINGAFSLVAEIHESDTHRTIPYTYHLLRVANRLVTHLDIHDSELAVAALLHDSVEDHAISLTALLEFERKNNVESQIPHDPRLQQELALHKISEFFSERVSALVKAVTNPPGLLSSSSYEVGIENYKNKVINSLTDPSAALLKFSDWIDNAVGINHSEQNNSSNDHFKFKYGGRLIEAFENRFNQDDLQNLLSEHAKEYINTQFVLAHDRLRTTKFG